MNQHMAQYHYVKVELLFVMHVMEESSVTGFMYWEHNINIVITLVTRIYSVSVIMYWEHNIAVTRVAKMGFSSMQQ